MIIDARSLPEGAAIESTVCIAGAGAAGLTLARHLIAKNIPVCLVESGGMNFDRATQDLACGDSVGLPYDPQSTRFRFFGGSTNAWGGLVRPISSHCFERRDWVGSAGWPLTRKHLDPYFERAYAALGIARDQLGHDSRLQRLTGASEQQVLINGGRLETRITPLARPTVFKDMLKSQLLGSPGFQLLQNANVVSIDTSRTPDRVRKFAIKTLCGKTLRCSAKVFVLAMGGIENARVLLLSNACQSNGLGNTHDLVGRYFMDHPRISCGRLRPLDKNLRFEFYDPSWRFDQMPSIASLSLSAEVQQKEALLDHRFYISPVYRGQDSLGFEELTWLKWKMRATGSLHLKGSDLKRIARDLPSVAMGAIGHVLRPGAFLKHHAITHVVEPAPHRDSRVTLSPERDALGCNRVCVDWRLGEMEKRTILRAQEILADALRAKQLGEVDIEGRAFATQSLPVKTSWHHMGTTRMDPDPKRGVVHSDCRLHGTGNLYIAGSSVFPSVGDDVPTLTIVALAIRLADHLAANLS